MPLSLLCRRQATLGPAPPGSKGSQCPFPGRLERNHNPDRRETTQEGASLSCSNHRGFTDDSSPPRPCELPLTSKSPAAFEGVWVAKQGPCHFRSKEQK